VKLEAGQTVFDVGAILTSGAAEPANIELVADIESGTSYDNFVVVLQSEGNFEVTDATDATHSLSVVVDGTCSNLLPFTSTVTRVFLPAGHPVVSSSEKSAIMACPTQSAIALVSGNLRYSGATLQGALILEELKAKVYRRNRDGLQPIDAGALFAEAQVQLDGISYPAALTTADESIMITLEDELRIAHDDDAAFQISFDLSSGAAPGNYVLVMADSSFMTFTDAHLGEARHPVISALDLSRLASELVVVDNSLEASFSNYPNPFRLGTDGYTTIAFNLGEDAVVDLEVYTITGELVKKILSSERRESGTHQDVTWSGRNGAGATVFTGTYFCRITAKYTSGRTETFSRKISVVR
jgi:hypothetical protein